MLSPEGALYQILKADAQVIALCSTRIYPGPIPQPRPVPAIIHWRVDRTEIPLLGPQKRGELVKFEFRIIACATTHPEVVNLHEAMVNALTKFTRGTVTDGGSPAQSIGVDSISDIHGDFSSYNQAIAVWEINSGVSLNCYIPFPV